MTGIGNWRDRCFDQTDSGAPLRGFMFGTLISSIAVIISVLIIDPTDFRLLGALLVGSMLIGGGCFAWATYLQSG